MADGMVLGVLLFVAGLLVGAGGVWLLTQRYEREREYLHRAIGQMQNELARHEIPAEEL